MFLGSLLLKRSYILCLVSLYFVPHSLLDLFFLSHFVFILLLCFFGFSKSLLLLLTQSVPWLDLSIGSSLVTEISTCQFMYESEVQQYSTYCWELMKPMGDVMFAGHLHGLVHVAVKSFCTMHDCCSNCFLSLLHSFFFLSVGFSFPYS